MFDKLRKKKFFDEFKAQLEKEKIQLEQNLKTLLAPDTEAFSKMPDFGGEISDFSIEADQIEEIGNALAVKEVLETNLCHVNEALEKIKAGIYGICGRCQKEIELKRLRVEPAADVCSKCVRKIENIGEFNR